MELDKEKAQGKWQQAKGLVQKKWGKLTDDDLDVINGDRKVLVGKLQERYGMSVEEAEREVSSYRDLD